MAEATDKRLLAGVLKLEEMFGERADIALRIKGMFDVLKAMGYDTPTVRTVIKRRAMDPADRVAGDELLEAYECALGMDDDDGLPITRDATLAAKLLASPERKAPTLKQRQASDAVAMAHINRMNRGF